MSKGFQVSSSQDGDTAALLAAKANRANVVKYLVDDCGQSPTSQNPIVRETDFLIRCIPSFVERASLDDVTTFWQNGDSLLIWACVKGSLETVQWLCGTHSVLADSVNFVSPFLCLTLDVACVQTRSMLVVVTGWGFGLHLGLPPRSL